jgi:hypothetical protein
VFSYGLSTLSVSYTSSYLSSVVVLLYTGLRTCVCVRGGLFVSCMPPSSTTSSENVGVGAMVTRESFLSIDFGVGACAFSKSAGSLG